MKSKKVTTLGLSKGLAPIVILVILALAATLIYALIKSEKVVTSPITPSRSVKLSHQDLAKGWNRYTNKELKFTLGYPEEMEIFSDHWTKTTLGNKWLTIITSTNKDEYKSKGADYTIGIEIFPNPKFSDGQPITEVSLDELYYISPSATYSNVEAVEYMGMVGRKITAKINSLQTTAVKFYLYKKGMLVSINNNFKNNSNYDISLADQILSTFEFLGTTSNQKKVSKVSGVVRQEFDNNSEVSVTVHLANQFLKTATVLGSQIYCTSLI